MATSGVPVRATRVLRAVLEEPKHQLIPAAIRIERSTARSDRGRARQTALTVWFSEGPALPGPASSGPSTRTLAGAVAGLVGVAALGALGVIAAQRQPRLGDDDPPRLLQPSTSDGPSTDQD
jgi:hypothetical protein